MINDSVALNKTRLVGTQDGQTIVPTYDWSTHLGVHFKKVPNIKQYHQFYFVAAKPERVMFKRFSDSEQLELDLRKCDLSWSPSSAPIVHPKGLSDERQWYLFEKIRQFCTSLRSKDLICLQPTALRLLQIAPMNNMSSLQYKMFKLLLTYKVKNQHQVNELNHV